ncbi:MAG: type III pantothenate kinase [Saprospiraceae bacterium]|nr:type III pantothenate kinase [Saprospiraceae bacterium]
MNLPGIKEKLPCGTWFAVKKQKQTMDLVIDIGNSNIVLAIRKNGEWSHIFRYESKDNQPQRYYESGFSNLLLEWDVQPNAIKSITVSSVVPDNNEKIKNAISEVTGLTPMIIGPIHLKQLDLPVPHANEIGTDLVANAYAAVKLYGRPCIVVDFGTALTFTVVHPGEGIRGVTIAPGIKTAFASLSAQTAQLPLVNLARPSSAIGQSTSMAIQAGILIGYEGLVGHLIDRIQAELEESYLTIATGGLSEAATNITLLLDKREKNLTIEGIYLIGNFFNTL